ncbi:hypothetical protein [Acetobacter pomorum]|uniref:hypothetical protein n=1 Tax=Acetobacter pomorum TaxID=65959 RepID=UPI00117732E9|nr:hypothetical protein [Acetobacter pomorum]
MADLSCIGQVVQGIGPMRQTLFNVKENLVASCHYLLIMTQERIKGSYSKLGKSISPNPFL